MSQNQTSPLSLRPAIEEETTASYIAWLLAELKSSQDDNAYLRWKLNLILPVFQEARDALPAVTLLQARLHNVSLTLADRMDSAGTAGREQFDALPK